MAPQVSLINFTESEKYWASLAAKYVVDVLSEKFDFPKLRSEMIVLERGVRESPLYVTNVPFELIIVTAEEDRPFQLIYQFAHEMGHLSAQSWKRFETGRQHVWIEEALCGAYSIYCMRKAADSNQGWLVGGAKSYLETYIYLRYAATPQIDSLWYSENKNRLTEVSGLEDFIMPVSRLIADEFADGEFIADNVAIASVPFSSDLSSYLTAWAMVCDRDRSVPKLLLDILKPDKQQASQ